MHLVFIIDIVQMCSTMLVCSAAEESLAKEAFGASTVDGLADMGSRVSRKKEFVPPISNAIKGGWAMPEAAESTPRVEQDPLVMDPDQTNGYTVRRSSVGPSSSSFLKMQEAQENFLP